MFSDNCSKLKKKSGIVPVVLIVLAGIVCNCGIAQSVLGQTLATDAIASGDSSSSNSSLSTTTFSTNSTNELLLAFVAADGPGNAPNMVASVSGAGLTWALVQRTNAEPGVSEIWRAFAATTLSSVKVTATLAQSAAANVTVVTFTGANAATGATASASGAGLPSASLKTTQAGSWVFGVGNDWDNAISRTVGFGQTMVHQYLATVGDTYWVQRQNGATPTPGTTVTINDIAPATDRYNLALVEVLPSGAAPPPSLTSIAVTPANPTILTGATQQFTATGTYSDNSTQNLTTQADWVSSNTVAATINAGSGLATGVSADTTTISAASGSVSGNTTLTVNAAPPTIATASLSTGTLNVAYSATLTASGGTPPYTWSISGALPVGLTLNSGTGVISGTPTAAGTASFTVQVSDSAAITAAKPLSITVTAAATSIWPGTAQPGLVDSGPDSAVELGVKFTSDVAGSITGIRFYKAVANTGTHVGNLWASNGAKLASATFTSETGSGWQQVNFSTPVAILANTVYVASYHTNVGHYSDNQNYFANAGIDNPPLHALKNGTSGYDGVYAYGASSAFPSNGWNSSNYWVDVVFTAGQTPISVSLVPTYAAIQVGGSQQFTATVAGSSNQAVTWTVVEANGGTISPSGLYTAPSTAGTYHVVATSAAAPTQSATATVSVMAAPPPPTTIFYDDFNGSALNPNWTVISRHGEYTQNETECNIPQQVADPSSATGTVTAVTITNALNAAQYLPSGAPNPNAVTCGDFNPDGTVRTAPSWWPYITGDIQWSSFNFTYGTVEIRAKFPSSKSNTWPATWLLGSNCQATNPYTGDTGVGTCPNIGQADYIEIDMTECYNSTSPWCQFHVANPGFGIGNGCDAVYPVADTNWHVYDTVWTASSVKQYMDGVLVSTCNQSLAKPMFLIIQTQTGGVSGNPNSAYLPATLSIDYVKVTQP